MTQEAVAIAILHRDNKILLAERPLSKSYGGFWELPGGKLKPNEEPFAALKRELKEELNILITQARLLVEHHHHYPEKSVRLSVFQITDFQNTPSGAEGQLIQWLSLKEALALKLLPATHEILTNVQI